MQDIFKCRKVTLDILVLECYASWIYKGRIFCCIFINKGRLCWTFSNVGILCQMDIYKFKIVMLDLYK